MKHYDGPAFYRRKGISRKPVSKPVNEMTTEQVRDTQEKPSRHVLDRTLVNQDNQDDETPAFLKEIKNFKPQKRSKSEKRKQQIKTNYFLSQSHRRHRLYDELTRELRLTYDDLILIAPIKTKSKMMLFIQQMIILMRKLTLINRHKNH